MGMNNTTNPRLTPDDVEYVRADQLVVGDVIIDFTPLHRDVCIPPTQRQLNKPVRGFHTVESITVEHRSVGDVLRFASDWISVPYAMNWRIKR
jgi:hypothetical protein